MKYKNFTCSFYLLKKGVIIIIASKINWIGLLLMEFNQNSSDFVKKHQEDLEEKFGPGLDVKRPNLFKEFIKWILVISGAVFVALFLRSFVFEWVIVDGASMENTLYNRQVLFIDKFDYIFGQPKYGDIVILQFEEGNWDYMPFGKENFLVRTFLPPQEEVNYIKRIIGLPGDEIDIKDGFVYRNGEKLEEGYAKGISEEKSVELPLKVDENCVFVMGDNREHSKDSRQIGVFELDRIKGKAVFRIRPLKEFGSIY